MPLTCVIEALIMETQRETFSPTEGMLDPRIFLYPTNSEMIL
jgi:hypothetical protein